MRIARWIGLSLGLIPSIAGAQTPAANEFRISTFTTGPQALPSVASDPSGGFVVAWLTLDGSSYGVSARRFDAAGAPRGAEFQVNTYIPGTAFFPAVATDAKGGFVVAWENGGGDGNGVGILARRYDAAGVALGPDFTVNAFVTGNQRRASVATAPGGGFTVVWQSDSQDGSGTAVVGRRFDRAGNPLTADFVVNTYTTGIQDSASIAAAADGRMVVVWRSVGQDGSGTGVFGQRFDPAGNRIGAEFLINAYTTDFQNVPEVAAGAQGDFVVIWQDSQYSGAFSIAGRRFNAAATPLGGDFVVHTFPMGATIFMAMAADTSLNFTVVWETLGGEDGSGFGVAGRRFSPVGTPRGPEFQLNTYTTGEQLLASVASDPAGNLTTAWMSDQLGSFNIFGQRYGGLVPSALAVDTSANGVLEPGETVNMQPSWRNVNGSSQTFAGTLSAVTGPAGATYTITDANGDYGTVPNGATQACVNCYGVSVSNPPTRPAAHWDAVATESLSPDAQGQVKQWALHVGDSFTDVPRANAFYGFVETLLHHSVTGGCGTGVYCPGNSTTRAQMAVFVLVAKEGAGYMPPPCTAPAFPDVPPSDPFCPWIEELARRNVTSGCGGGNYCPTAAVSREQMAVFVLRTLDPALNPPACTTPVFNDVPADSPFCRWIEELARREIVTGCAPDLYCPTAPVTREQMAVFLTGTFGLTLYGP